MKVLSKSEWTILTLILVYSFIPTFGGLFRVLEFVGGPAIAPDNPRASATPFPIVLHILSSFMFCLLGAIQFLPSIRRQHPAAHRAFGRIVAMAGCLSAGSGLWMTHFYSFPISLQGNLLYWARIILGFLMICFIVWSVIAVRFRNVFQHSAYMLRAYAIGQGASTQTFIGIGWMIFFETEMTGPLRDATMVFAWALNLLIAEVLIWAILAPKRQSVVRVLSENPSGVGQ
ncbi:DUF2306 domain-containing protein [Sulfitobacter sp.]|jgi:hypothetical protein|uniref:DUF2306 domain-containing protein n=1 Tax=Sulfitobacter sp. TaxID=1903071 RepID=UPI003002F84B